jgi:hypothetical protein
VSARASNCAFFVFVVVVDVGVGVVVVVVFVFVVVDVVFVGVCCSLAPSVFYQVMFCCPLVLWCCL